MRVLLGSGGFRTEERRDLLRKEMRMHFGDIERILFVPFALHDHDGYVRRMQEAGLDGGYELDGIHRHDSLVQAVQEAQGIFVGGGNSFRLTHDLQRFGLMNVIRDRVRDGVPYLGVSAGSNVACPSMMTTNDMPIVMPQSFETLGLVSFQINPHYYDGYVFVRHGEEYAEHFGETRDQRIAEFHEMNDAPVVGLWEGGLINIDGSQVQLVGAGARIFIKGQSPVDVEPPGDLGELVGV